MELATTKNLLHPRQVTELEAARAALQGNLDQPAYIRAQLADGGAQTQEQIRKLDEVLAQAPRPYESGEIDDAVRLEASLRDQWSNGMPTQAEMRRNVSGAVDKHRAWEKRNKDAVLTWKHVRRRLHASGVSDHGLADESDVSNVEMFRPVGGAGELNMHGEQIPGLMQFGPTPGAGPAVVFTAEEMETLRGVNPKMADMMPLLDNDGRAKIATILRAAPVAAEAIQPAPVGGWSDAQATGEVEFDKPRAAKRKTRAKKKRAPMNLSDEERLRRSERAKANMPAMNAARAAKRAEAQQAAAGG